MSLGTQCTTFMWHGSPPWILQVNVESCLEGLEDGNESGAGAKLLHILRVRSIPHDMVMKASLLM